MYYGLPIASKILYQILKKIDALTSNFGAQIPLGQLLEWLPKCTETHSNYQIEEGNVYNTLSETHMHIQSNSHVCYHFLQLDIKKLVLDP